MPIHDHEGMIVFSKCIKGTVVADYYHIKKEAVNNETNRAKNPHSKRYGIPIISSGSYQMKEGMMDIVRPCKNNIHAFRPIEESVIFE